MIPVKCLKFSYGGKVWQIYQQLLSNNRFQIKLKVRVTWTGSMLGKHRKWSKTAFKQTNLKVKSSFLLFQSGIKLLSHVTPHFWVRSSLPFLESQPTTFDKSPESPPSLWHHHIYSLSGFFVLLVYAHLRYARIHFQSCYTGDGARFNKHWVQIRVYCSRQGQSKEAE